MTNSEVIPAELLQRMAVVYVRQSSPAQVVTNLESQRLQYDLVRIALDEPSHDAQEVHHPRRAQFTQAVTQVDVTFAADRRTAQ